MESLAEPDLITDRLIAVAPLSNEIVAIDQADDGSWALGFDNETVVLMEWAQNPCRIILSAPLGSPPQDRQAEVYEIALSFTALWRDSGGAKLAKGGDQGELLLIRELHSETGGGWDLLPVLEHFSHVAKWWHDYVFGAAPPRFDAPFGVESLQMRA
jgi:hypothetical protein